MKLIVSVELDVDRDKFEQWHPLVEDIRKDVAGTLAAQIDESKLEQAGIEVVGVSVREEDPRLDILRSVRRGGSVTQALHRLNAVAAHRCNQLAVKGTGVGICDTPLDRYGNCSNAGDHQDE